MYLECLGNHFPVDLVKQILRACLCDFAFVLYCSIIIL